MIEVVALLPVLDRPHRVRPLLENLYASIADVHVRPLFITSPDDHAEEAEVAAAALDYEHHPCRPAVVCAPWPAGPGDYARKINLGIRASEEPWILAGADDLSFCPGWADEALAVAADEGKRFIGTQDCGNPHVLAGIHTTHPVVARSYVEQLGTIDEPGLLYHEGYDHQHVDVEAVATAKQRDEWAFAWDAFVEHEHPLWGRAEEDATYAKGRAHARADQALYMRRKALWGAA